jgi:putative transposase
MGIRVRERLVAVLLNFARIHGLPGSARVKRLLGIATGDGLANWKSHCLSINQLWVTGITEHPTRERQVYCCCVLGSFSRRIVGWSIETVLDPNLVVNAPDLAITNREPTPGALVNADHRPSSQSGPSRTSSAPPA